VFYAFILLLYKDPGSGIRKALFSRIPDPLKKAKDPADPDSTDPDPDLHHCFTPIILPIKVNLFLIRNYTIHIMVSVRIKNLKQ
jgi:hypothetical protein